MKRFLSLILIILALSACEGKEIRISIVDSDPASTAIASPTATATATRTSTPTVTASPTAATFAAYTTAPLNLRSGAGTSYQVLAVLPAGTRVTVIGRSTDGSWLNVSTPSNGNGWVSAQYIVIGTPTATPTIDPTPTREVLNNRISYNINGESIPDRAYLTGHLQRLCPSTVLVMNNLSYAVELYNLLHQRCGTIVISRSWSALEGDEWFYRSAQNFVDQWKREGHPEIVRYSTNEPSFGGLRSVAQFVAAEVELMRVARANGFTVAMGNFSVGYVQPGQITSGAFDPYLRALNQYNHYLALHEYAVVALPFGVGQWGVESLTDRNRVQPASWPLAQALPTRLWNGELPPYWYLRRGDWFLIRADQLGIQRPRIILTEFGWDNLPNIKSYVEPLRQQFGLDRYMRDMRGVNTYTHVWRWYWPNWTFWQAACEQLRWADSIYPADYIGMQLFTISMNPHWLQTSFLPQENPEHLQLHRCLEQQ